MGLLALHKLIAEGKDDTPEADAIRDSLEVPLRALNKSEKDRAQWLSEDLYSINQVALPGNLKLMTSEAQALLNASYEARQSADWDQALEYLRGCNEYVLPAQLSYLRGAIWCESRNYDIAEAFFQHASSCEQKNGMYRAMHVYSLEKFDPSAAAKVAREILSRSDTEPPVVVAQAANALIRGAKASLHNELDRVRRELIPILDRTLDRLDQDRKAESRGAAYAMAAGLLGFCYEYLGNEGSAVSSFSRGLLEKPNEAALLVARGILQYGSSPRAISDLVEAVQLGYPKALPYLFLAHYYLITNQFDNCRSMCERGLLLDGSNTTKSQLYEWLAIAQAELGFAGELVSASFDAAIRLDPGNDFARENLSLFQASLSKAHGPAHAEWQQKTEAAIKSFGLAERRYDLAAYSHPM